MLEFRYDTQLLIEGENLDEDEMARFLSSSYQSCPYYQTDDEYKIMKEHAAEGGKIILQIFYNMDDAKFRQIAYEIARFHHEKYNGRGYPDGLVGEQIPLHARIMAIADVFDAVSQKRCYRDAMTLEDSFSIIEKGIGTDFDPNLAQIFLDHKDEVIKLMKQFQE